MCVGNESDIIGPRAFLNWEGSPKPMKMRIGHGIATQSHPSPKECVNSLVGFYRWTIVAVNIVVGYLCGL